MKTLYTFGYQGTSLKSFAEWAIRSGVIVVDTRLHPWSPRPEWRPEAIRAALPVDHYGRMTSLGNVNYKSGGPIKIADPDYGVPIVAGLLNKAPVVLLCACKHVNTCHRRVVAELISAFSEAVIVHLTPADLSKAS